MKKLLERLKKDRRNIGKREVQCPRCRKKVLVPAKAGKTIRVTCSNCRSVFELRFTTPFSEIFQWKKSKGLAFNLKATAQRFGALPRNAKISLSIFAVVLFVLVYLIVAGIVKLFS